MVIVPYMLEGLLFCTWWLSNNVDLALSLCKISLQGIHYPQEKNHDYFETLSTLIASIDHFLII